jgi:hypothetical protein
VTLCAGLLYASHRVRIRRLNASAEPLETVAPEPVLAGR